MKELAKKAKINWTRVVLVSAPGNWLGTDVSFDISPKEFLNFAKSDIASNNKKGLVNGLTNAKRSIDCEADLFVNAIGLCHSEPFPSNVTSFIKYSETSGAGNRNLRLVEALGVAPSSLINRYRTLRNKLEHFYKIPEETDVKDSIELAELFINAVDNAMRSIAFPLITYKDQTTEDPGITEICYEKGGYFIVSFFSNWLGSNETIGEVEVSIDDPLYMPLMKLCLSTGTEIGWEDAIKDFIILINPNIPREKIEPSLRYA